MSVLGFFVTGSVSSASDWNLAALFAFFSASGLVSAGAGVVAAEAVLAVVAAVALSKVAGVRGVADGTGSVTFWKLGATPVIGPRVLLESLTLEEKERGNIH